MRTAFKEWAVVVDALARGEQILILRKGGISEGKGGFKVDHEKFLLFPTQFHQQQDSVIPSAQKRYEEIKPGFSSPDIIRITHYAEIVDWMQVESLEVAQRLAPFHIWKEEVVSQRFEWGKGANIFALVVRVHELSQEWEFSVIPAYGGCKSWVEMETDIPLEAAIPVLDEVVFVEKWNAIKAVLSGPQLV